MYLSADSSNGNINLTTNRGAWERWSCKNITVCICFFGVIARSLEWTIESIKKNIYNVLEENHIKYDVLIHNNYVDNIYSYREVPEDNIKINNNNIKLLKPTIFIETIQNEFN